ncbi:Imm30 family immunity protein [Paenibacillus sp. SAF-054]|uniref:Imm30 family immunity protein n=1 Tax=unclassified Paenibacillus TaxID=185978 RepID=UPI003F819B11
MRTEQEIIDFEDSLEQIHNHCDYKIIGDLCSVFEDSTEQHEVMWGLLHLIEKYEGREALFELVKSMPKMIESAREWLEIINYRILNHQEYRELYGQVLKETETTTKEIIIKLLEDIKKEDPIKFEKSVLEVIKYIM